MLGSAYTSFNDPDHFSAAVRAAEVRLTVTRRCGARTSLMRADLHALWLQEGRESFSRVAHVTLAPTRVAAMFAQPGGAPLIWRGREAAPGALIVVAPGEDGYQRCEGPAHWASLSLAPENFAAMGRALNGIEPRPASSRPFSPLAAPMRRLSWLHGEVARLAREAPWVLAEAEPARALEQALIHALMSCLAGEGPKEDAAARRRGGQIVAKLEAMLHATPNLPLHLPEICLALGVSERTLQTHCMAQLGVAPIRYLQLRRLHMARRLLRETESGQGSVTEIATRCGFWELGRFAVAYRRLFGETPSATLRRPPDDCRRFAESA
jgi:AraC-like DNA-binding protein